MSPKVSTGAVPGEWMHELTETAPGGSSNAPVKPR